MTPSILESHHIEPEVVTSKISNSNPIFDPSIHLSYKRPAQIHTLESLSLDPSPISPIASTDPFPFLSSEGIAAHRRELLSQDVLNNCMYHTRPGSVQLRGMAPRYAPFIYQFWTSKEVIGLVSQLAGVDLVPAMDFEICHTNIQLAEGEGLESVRRIPVEPPEATEEAVKAFNEKSHSGSKDEDKTKQAAPAVVPWHRDSHPFVCVVMLSDARHMTDGETELATGDAMRTVKVKSPQIGGAAVLQGRHVSHLAIPAGNMPERITIVTSFRPRDPRLFDDTTNMNVRTKSLLPELYYQWTSYRLRLLSERFRMEADGLDALYEDAIQKTDNGRKGQCRVETVDIEKLTKWMEEQMRYMRQTLYEMRPVTAEDNFVKNRIDNVL